MSAKQLKSQRYSVFSNIKLNFTEYLAFFFVVKGRNLLQPEDV